MSLPPVPRRDFGKRPPVHPPPVSPRSNSIPTSPVSNQPAPPTEKFGACLQSSYEAISKRHESELRVSAEISPFRVIDRLVAVSLLHSVVKGNVNLSLLVYRRWRA